MNPRRLEAYRVQQAALLDKSKVDADSTLVACANEAYTLGKQENVEALLKELMVVGEQALNAIARFQDVDRRERKFMQEVLQTIAKRKGIRLRGMSNTADIRERREKQK